MIRRTVSVVAVMGVVVLLASASPASAQLGLPFDFGAFLRDLFQSLADSPFLSFFRPIFAFLLQLFTGSCAPFCAS